MTLWLLRASFYQAMTSSVVVQDTLALAARMMPNDAYNRLAQGLFGFLNEWMMNLLADDAVPAYNMYGLFRLADDLASLQALADASQPAGLAVYSLSDHPHDIAYALQLFFLQVRMQSLCVVCLACTRRYMHIGHDGYQNRDTSASNRGLRSLLFDNRVCRMHDYEPQQQHFHIILSNTGLTMFINAQFLVSKHC